ncbi:MAG: hypothetical protein KGL39_16835 [Patescibacteria group bacterium]|nr:hypothetical protein [Patescibacteria group bacterium]
MKTIILMELDLSKPVTDLVDKIAGRAYTLDGVEDVEAKLVWQEPERKKAKTLVFQALPVKEYGRNGHTFTA